MIILLILSKHFAIFSPKSAARPATLSFSRYPAQGLDTRRLSRWRAENGFLLRQFPSPGRPAGPLLLEAKSSRLVHSAKADCRMNDLPKIDD